MSRKSRDQRDADLALRLHAAALHLLRRLRVEDSASGLSAPALSALSVVVFGGPVTIGDLATAEQVTPATISRLVTFLEDEGLVTRSTDENDKRVQRLQATARGRRMLEEGRARRVQALKRSLGELRPADLEALERGVDVLETLVRRQDGAG